MSNLHVLFSFILSQNTDTLNCFCGQRQQADTVEVVDSAEEEVVDSEEVLAMVVVLTME